MNLKTTLVLLILVAAGAVLVWPLATGWFGLSTPVAETETSPALAVLEKEMTPEQLQRIEVTQGSRKLVLERGPGGDWSLPGRWPTRKLEVQELVSLLSGLHSRFAPEPLTGHPETLDQSGQEHPAITVKVKTGEKEHTLTFAEMKESSTTNRFSQPTSLRIDGGDQVIRLGPGILAILDRPLDYYLQRRLFSSERVAGEAGATDKTERLAARQLTVEDKKDGANSYSLTREGEDWQVTAPVRDRTDPDKLKQILGAAPDLWAEKFVERGSKPLSDFGLESPEQVIAVTRPGGDTVTLLIGKTSPTVRERQVTRPSPPPQPGMPPMPPLTETVREELRYAKLKDNDQVFEIKADRVKDLLVPVKDLRDARLARFNTTDVRQLELKYAGLDMVLVKDKDKDRWRLEKPIKADAESSKINDLLDKLSGLQARDADVIDKADAKTYGFDNPAAVGTLKVTVEEEKGEGNKKTKKTRTFGFTLGKHDLDKKKLYLKVDGLERVDAVEDGLVALAKRPVLAYRGRRVLDFSTADLERIEVQKPGETLALKQVKDTWRLETPVAVEADSGKAGGLASTLSNLEATEYVNDAPKPQDLEAYGLAKDPLRVKISFTQASKKPVQTLLIGKVRPGKAGEFFARLESSPSVFALKKETRESIDQGSLAYRPLQLWQVAAEDVKSLRIQQAGQPEYTLSRKDGAWHIGGPFEASAVTAQVEPILNELTSLRSERYETHASKDLKAVGLDVPYLRLVLTATVKPSAEEKKPAKPEKEWTLIVGKPTEKDPKVRFAKLGDSEAIFVVGDKLLMAVDKEALGLLNPKLLTLEAKTIERMQWQGGATPLDLQRKGEEWQVKAPPTAPFTADRAAVEGLLRDSSELEAVRFAAYGPKVDLAKFGLDKPGVTVVVTVQPPAVAGKTPPAVTHSLALGKIVEGSSGERYARLDNGPGVAVLSSSSAGEFTKSYLDFVNRTLVKADAGQAKGLVRQMGEQVLELRKSDTGWQIVKPLEIRGDDSLLDQLVDQLASLQARRVAGYQAKDLKPFGLDAPAATVTLRTATPVILKIGKEAEGPGMEKGERFAQVEGSEVVGVLPASLARQLLADPIRFRERTVARFTDADRALLERGGARRPSPRWTAPGN